MVLDNHGYTQTLAPVDPCQVVVVYVCVFVVLQAWTEGCVALLEQDDHPIHDTTTTDFNLRFCHACRFEFGTVPAQPHHERKDGLVVAPPEDEM